MEPKIQADDGIAAGYFDLFVNRLAYTVQSSKPDSATGRCYYYRPKGRVSLSRETVKSHLEGRLTIGLYAINPATQRCKWVAIDADYSSALDDLLKLQWELRQDGVEAAPREVPTRRAPLDLRRKAAAGPRLPFVHPLAGKAFAGAGKDRRFR